MRYYVAGPGGVVRRAGFGEWAAWCGGSPQDVPLSDGGGRVGWDVLPGGTVSTILLGIDHNFGGDGPPLIFETMVFDENWTGRDQWRWRTADEARAGHAAVVAWVKGEGEEPE